MSPKKEKKKPTAVIIIRLEIEGDADGALEVVEALLDIGELQDGINDHHHDFGDDFGELHVISAVASLESIDLGEK